MSEMADIFIEHGRPEFRRTNLAMFAAGFATFALMYCVQPLLPAFAIEFHVTPVGASLALSLTTFTLAGALLVASALSESWGRKPMMVGAIMGAAALTMISAAIPHWGLFLVFRAAIGLVLSGLPAVAMAYLAEEMHPRSIGLAMGLFVGGSGFGGMAGRLLTSILSAEMGWRWATVAIGVTGLVSGIIFAIRLPPSRHFVPRALDFTALVQTYRAHLSDGAMRMLYLEAFLIMGAFVAVYNYITFRLLAPPFSLSQTVVGLIFVVYLVGVGSSAWAGDLAGRWGRARLLPVAIIIELAGALLTLFASVPIIVLGIALVTFGFFASHSLASSWVGTRARSGRAQAAALYLFLYYLGSSVAGSLGGLAWSHAGWPGVVTMIALLLALAFIIARRLAILPSPAPKVM